ncbi:hypothetical protein J6O48_02815 [bacterium]|nr:hypothetical protein [bacterium]
MKPTTLKERNLDEDVIFEDGDTQEDTGMTEEELKIESLKIATNIGKLMSNVTPDDIVNIAETVANFIKNGDTSASMETNSTDNENTEDTEDTEEDFVTDEDTEQEDTSEENTEDTEEDFKV